MSYYAESVGKLLDLREDPDEQSLVLVKPSDIRPIDGAHAEKLCPLGAARHRGAG